MTVEEPMEPDDPRNLPDDELDQLILARLALVGVSLDPLPEDDPAAPADRRRVLRAARQLLRGTVPVLASLELDPEWAPPHLYPTGAPAIDGEGRDG